VYFIHHIVGFSYTLLSLWLWWYCILWELTCESSGYCRYVCHWQWPSVISFTR